jgi:hypothetical protein
LISDLSLQCGQRCCRLESAAEIKRILLPELVVDWMMVLHGGHDMNRCNSGIFALFGLLMLSAAGAESLDTLPPPNLPLASNVAAAPSPHATMETSRWKGTRQATKSKLAGLKAGVAKEVRETSAFVHDQTNIAGTPSRWLIGLAACGLIVFQLRRKHKSLPQRRIVTYY